LNKFLSINTSTAAIAAFAAFLPAGVNRIQTAKAGATAGPKRFSFVIRALVIVVMDKVFVLGEKIPRGRITVIGAKYCDHLRIGKSAGQTSGRIGVYDDIGIDKPEHVATRLSGGLIARTAWTHATAG